MRRTYDKATQAALAVVSAGDLIPGRFRLASLRNVVKSSIGPICFALMMLYAPGGFAQGIFLFPQTVTAPVGSYQTLTAIVTGYNDKTVTWSITAGTCSS